MLIAITGAAGFIGRALLPKLADQHHVLATDLHAADSAEACDVLDLDALRGLCARVDAVVHLAAAAQRDDLSQRENETRIFDTRLKGTHNLLQAAQEANLKRVVLISDLRVLANYDADLLVCEDFVPQPATEAEPLSAYLAELIAREYARLGPPGQILTLRLGTVIDPTTLASDARCEDGWLALDDAVAAILRGLDCERFAGMGEWGLYNLAADVPDNRYSLLKIQAEPFGFFPAEDFTAWREDGP